MRIFAGIMTALFLAVPVTDQLACEFCGPTPDTSFLAEEVPCFEETCVLQGGFERPETGSESEEAAHIHFCLLHSTFVALQDHDLPDFELRVFPYAVDDLIYDGEYLNHVFHPPPPV